MSREVRAPKNKHAAMATRISLSGAALSGFAFMIMAMGGFVAPNREEQLITSVQSVDDVGLGQTPPAGAMPPEGLDAGNVGFILDIAGGAAQAGIDLDQLLATLDEPVDVDQVASEGAPTSPGDPAAVVTQQAPPAVPDSAQAAPPAAAEPAPAAPVPAPAESAPAPAPAEPPPAQVAPPPAAEPPPPPAAEPPPPPAAEPPPPPQSGASG